MTIVCSTCDVDLPCICGPRCTCEDAECTRASAADV